MRAPCVEAEDPAQQFRVACFQLPDAFDLGPEHSPTDQCIEGVLDLLGGERQAQSIGNPPEHLGSPVVDRHGDVRVAAPMLESMRRPGHD